MRYNQGNKMIIICDTVRGGRIHGERWMWCWSEEGAQKESISFQKHRSRLKSECGTKEKRQSNEKEKKRV
jgi:hypothetical protein